jgi:hypothetical protein
MFYQVKIVTLLASLMLAVVAGSTPGHSAPEGKPIMQKLADEKRIEAGEGFDFKFTLPDTKPDEQVRLSTMARVDWPDLGGATFYMMVTVNGQPLVGSHLINKPPDLMFRNGMDMPWFWTHIDAWNLVYAPDFSDRISTAPMEYGVASPEPFRFVWDVTTLVRPGENTIRFHQNKVLNQPTPLVLRDVKIEQGAPLARPEGVGVTPAPTGVLPTYVASGAQKIAMQVELANDGRIRLKSANRTFEITSRTSLPNGQWTQTSPTAKWRKVDEKSDSVKWSGNNYSVSRRVEVRGDHLRVFDTISNTGNELAGVMIENRLALPAPASGVLLGGRPPIGETSFRESPSHPTALALGNGYAIGLVAEDDIFRIHGRVSTAPGVLGLSDPRLGIAPGASHTLEWSIYPQPGGDYWSFINAVRRNWGVNFPMEAIAFDGIGSTSRRTPEEQRAWVMDRKLSAVISTQSAFWPEEVEDIPEIAADPILSKVQPPTPILAEGPAIPLAKTMNELVARWAALNRSAAPPVKSLLYIHPNISSDPGSQEKYADSKVLDETGKHLTTPFSYPLYLYLPTLETTYGQAMMETIQFITRDLKLDGIYMDEFNIAGVPAYMKHKLWDGVSAEIDEQTHAVKGKVSSSILLQQPWRDAMVKYLRANGKMLVGNTHPHTRTATDWHVQFFVETVSYSLMIESHLSTPWGLANHNTDYDAASQAQMARRILDYGGLAMVYNWPDEPLHPSFSALMYPITPEELREGMVLGRERIVTNRSGRYGWNDGGDADVYVFDGTGALAEKPDVKLVRDGNKNFYDVRMPSDHLAILVKQTSRDAEYVYATFKR